MHDKDNCLHGKSNAYGQFPSISQTFRDPVKGKAARRRLVDVDALDFRGVLGGVGHLALCKGKGRVPIDSSGCGIMVS